LSERLSKRHPRLETITINGSAIPSIKAELRECGITESVVFPDLDGLGREVNQLWLAQIWNMEKEQLFR